jgi:hypothetical protein
LLESTSYHEDKLNNKDCRTPSKARNLTEILNGYEQRLKERKQKRDYYIQRRVEGLKKLQFLM